jgi:hypothetical protein
VPYGHEENARQGKRLKSDNSRHRELPRKEQSYMEAVRPSITYVELLPIFVKQSYKRLLNCGGNEFCRRILREDEPG